MLKLHTLSSVAAAFSLLCFTQAANAQRLSLRQVLVSPDTTFIDAFSFSLALEDNIALVGDFTQDNDDLVYDGVDGAAYLFNPNTGKLLKTLIPPDGKGGSFGSSVALDGNLALIGADGDDDKARLGGSAYLYDINTDNFIRKLTAPDAAEFDRFGFEVDLEGNLALIGASGDDDNGDFSGSAYLFDVNTGELLRKLTAPDGAEDDSFGVYLALEGNLALIGAVGDDDKGDSSGSAYLFNINTGEFLRKLTAPDGADGDLFGRVALEGNLALIGASGDDDNGDFSGSAYLFDVNTGELLYKLTAPDAASGDRFGVSVALDGDLALVGADFKNDPGFFESGAVYLFNVKTGKLLQKLNNPDPQSVEGFGRSLALDGNKALIGSREALLDGVSSVYVYTIIPEPTTITASVGLSLTGLLLKKVKKNNCKQLNNQSCCAKGGLGDRLIF